MNKTLLKSIKTAFVFALIGATVAVAIPPVIASLAAAGAIASAGAFGAATAASVLHTTGVFALFGLLVPPVEKLADFVFGKDKAESKSDCSKKHGDKLTINQDIDVGVDARSVNFVAKLDEQTVKAAETTRQI